MGEPQREEWAWPGSADQADAEGELVPVHARRVAGAIVLVLALLVNAALVIRARWPSEILAAYALALAGVLATALSLHTRSTRTRS